MFRRALMFGAWGLLAACKGTALDVGDLRELVFDGGPDEDEGDAATPEEDAAELEAGAQPRDAQLRDARVIEIFECSSDEKCPRAVPHCMPTPIPTVSICVECYWSDHCRPDQHCEGKNFVPRCVPFDSKDERGPNESGP